MSNRLNCVSRSLLVALAAIAVVFVLLRPACALWNSHHSGAGAPLAGAFSMDGSHASGESSTQCCATVSDPSLGAVLHVANEVLDGSTAAAVPFAVFTGTALLGRQLLRLRAPPPHPRSYYVRSARILR